MTTDLLQMHCQARSRDLYAAFEAVTKLDTEGRAALMKEITEDRDLPLREDMARYRLALAQALKVEP